MYCKLFASLYQGTLRGRSHEILVFTNLMAHASKDGVVDKHFRAIAEETGLGVDEVKAAILVLEAPDSESRSPEAQGARLQRLDEHRVWGWQIVNYAKYRAIRSEDDRAEQNRLAQARWRERNKSKQPSATSKRDKPKQKQEAEVEAEAKETPPAIPPAAPPGDIVEKAPDTRHSAFIKAYSEAYEIETGSKYIFQPREAKTLQTFLARCPATVEQMLTMLRWAWNRSKEPFASKHHSAATIQDFLTDWQKLVMDRSQQRAGKDGQPKKPKHSSCL